MKREQITQYIKGELTEAERAAVKQWIGEDTRHEKEYLEMKKIWDISAVAKEAPEVDVDKAWDRFVDLRQQRGSATVVSLPSRAAKRAVWWPAAISIAVLGMVSLWLLQVNGRKEMHLQTAVQTSHATLPDGSTVALDRNTELDYHNAWLGKRRQVSLRRGTVFFDVQKDKSRPFVIQSGKTQITVLGTSFHVRREGLDTEVIVASGSVRVQYADQEIVLKPQQMLTVSDTSKQHLPIDTVPDQLYRYYIHQEFIFENTPLDRVFATLSKAYAVQFKIDDPAVAKLPLTVTFEQQPLAEMLRVIVRTFDLHIEKRDSTYFIK